MVSSAKPFLFDKASVMAFNKLCFQLQHRFKRNPDHNEQACAADSGGSREPDDIRENDRQNGNHSKKD
jgi:hypothetical protein